MWISVLKSGSFHPNLADSWKEPVVEDEIAFASIKAGLDLAGPGEKIVLNTGDFHRSLPQHEEHFLIAQVSRSFVPFGGPDSHLLWFQPTGG